MLTASRLQLHTYTYFKVITPSSSVTSVTIVIVYWILLAVKTLVTYTVLLNATLLILWALYHLNVIVVSVISSLKSYCKESS